MKLPDIQRTGISIHIEFVPDLPSKHSNPLLNMGRFRAIAYAEGKEVLFTSGQSWCQEDIRRDPANAAALLAEDLSPLFNESVVSAITKLYAPQP
jgi:hypothetical protein